MNRANKIFKYFSTLNSQCLVNKHRNAVRFEAQNINWDFEELNYQTMAVSKGLMSLGFQQGDNFLLRVSAAQQAQAYTSKLGIAEINGSLISSQANTITELGNQLKNNNIKGIIFQPTLPLAETITIDSLYALIPQLKQHLSGNKINSNQYPNLKMLVQTNFYSYPGIYKFKSLLNYVTDKYMKIQYKNIIEPLPLPSSMNTLMVTDITHDFTFRTAILNSIVYGRPVVCVQPKNVTKLCELYDNKIDFIGTTEIASLSNEVRVIVEQKSSLFSSHRNRVII